MKESNHKISKKTFQRILNFLLIIIASSFFFRKPSTWLIIIFAIFCLINYRKTVIENKCLIPILIIASPFLLEILFFWNNEVFKEGLKSTEKTISLILFPIFIICNHNKLNVYQIIRYYTFITSAVIFSLFLWFIFTSPKFFTVYLKGQELWEVGYVFAASFNMHAPALNMHLSFLTACCFWFLTESFFDNNRKYTWTFTALTLINFFIVLFVNTKLAVVNTILAFAIIFYFQVVKRFSKKQIFTFLATGAIASICVFIFYIGNNPYMKEKYLEVPLTHIDKIGKLDEVENPEATIHSSLVTRLSIWLSAYNVATENILIGVGSADGKNELNAYYQKTNQQFLARNKFPAHNQFLDFTIKFGLTGFAVVIIYIGFIGYLGLKLKNSLIIIFFIIFLSSNLVDDFLIRFDGIVFSGFWISLFVAHYLQSHVKDGQLTLSI